jgi:hypothetical protein
MRMSRRGEPRAPAVWVPLLAYVAGTVLAPLLNGAWRGDGFAEHVLIAVTVPALITLCCALLRNVLRDRACSRYGRVFGGRPRPR